MNNLENEKKDLIKKDCFAYRPKETCNKQCYALTELICKRKNCNFYMTKQEYNKKMKNFKGDN